MSIKTVEDGEEISLPTISTKVKFIDKSKAIDMLNKMQGLYDKDNIRKIQALDENGNPTNISNIVIEHVSVEKKGA